MSSDEMHERLKHPPDGGEPQGSRDPGRPAMLGRRFRTTIALGMLAGLALALCAHWVLTSAWYAANGWSWLVVGLGGLAVGGALSLFLYGAATDRSDTGPTEPHGRADVQERGEWSRALDRRRGRRSSPRPR